MRKFFFGQFVVFGAVLLSSLFLCLGTVSAANLTVTPNTNNTDNLIGASNASWKFTATTTAELVAGDIIQIVLPLTSNVQPFSLGNVLVVSSSTPGLVLYPTRATSTQGMGAAMNEANRAVIYGFATSTIPSGTTFWVTVSGINNPVGMLSFLQDLTWTINGGTPDSANNPQGGLTRKFEPALTATRPVIRAGGPLVSDENSGIVASSYALSAANTLTFTIRATSSIPAGGKIVINLPSEYSLLHATASTQYINASTSNELRAVIANGAIATTTGGGVNSVTLTTSANETGAGDILTVVLSGLTNPATAGVYRPFYIYTTKANGGLLDGSTQGFEDSDYGSGAPPPIDMVTIGGDNNINIQVVKQLANNATSSLTADERAQVKITAGNPDKGFFAGQRWLDSLGQAHYVNLLDGTYMIGTEPFSKGDSTFYESFLVPAMKSINAVGGITATTTIVFGVPDASTTIEIDGGVSGQNAFVNAYSDSFQSFTPVYTSTAYTTPGFNAGTGKGYAKLNVKSGQNWNFTVMSGEFGSSGNFTSGGVRYWPPSIPATYIATAGTHDLGAVAYIQADQTLNVTLKKSGTDTTVANACVGVKPSGGGQSFMGVQDQICTPNAANNVYQFKVPTGSVTVTVSRPGFGKPEEYPVGINGTTNKTINLSSPDNYISITVRDVSGNGIVGAPVFAHGSNGFGQEMTGSGGTTTIYVAPGTYQVEGFAPSLGQLTAQSKTVSAGVNPEAIFTVDSSTMKTISGRVVSGGAGVSGVKIGARGTGATTGGNGTETGSDGSFTLYVPIAGTYEVGGWSPDYGGLAPKTADTTAGNVTLANWTLGAQGTLRIHVKNSSNISPMFGGAFDATSNKGNGSDSWTASTTVATAKFVDIKLPAGTYDVHVGSPMVGEISPVGSTAIVTAGQTKQITFDAADIGTLINLTGTVDGASAGYTVWGSKLGGPGYFNTTTAADGSYTLKLPASAAYRVGVRASGYVATEGDVPVTATTTDLTQNFTLATASAAIAGTVTDSTSAATIANAMVFAKKTGSGGDAWISGTTDASGNYSLAIDSGSWTVYADGPCYTRSAGLSTAAGTGKNIALTATAGCSVGTPTMQSMTAASGGQISKADGANITFPNNALGTSQSTISVSLNKSKTSACPSLSSTPLPDSIQSISASDSSGQVTSLGNSADVVIPYDPTTLPTGFDETKLQISYCDTSTGQWTGMAGTVNTTDHTITFKTNHLTDFAPTIPGVPDQIAGLTATAASASGINLSWTASPTADSYLVFRNTTDGPFAAAQQIATSTSASYADSGLTAGTQYYYKIAGYNSNGEGFISASANATAQSATVANNTTGTGGSSSILPLTVPVTPVIEKKVPAVAGKPVFTRTLSVGAENKEVWLLQETLQALGFLPAQTKLTGYFGQVTRVAVVKFQQAKGIKPANGLVGPATRAILNQLSKTTPVTVKSTAVLTPTFTRTLSVGAENKEVKLLQEILQTLGFLPAGTKLTGYFGQATRAAVVKFQQAKGLKPANGLVGPATRAELNKPAADSVIPVTGAELNKPATDARTQLSNQIQALLKQIRELQAQMPR